ncbi:hypothetical protein Tco_1540831 [Tanacetum coccineum]
MLEKESPEKKGEVAVAEEVLVNPSFPDQLVTIGGGLSEAGKDQLKRLLKDNMRVFTWESSDMTEMQSLNGKLASLSRFLAKSAERSLPFLNTLKNITKENKHEYRWMQEAAFQQMKRLITELPSLTPPHEKETLYAYLAVSAEAVSAVLLTDRKGRQCPV